MGHAIITKCLLCSLPSQWSAHIEPTVIFLMFHTRLNATGFRQHVADTPLVDPLHHAINDSASLCALYDVNKLCLSNQSVNASSKRSDNVHHITIQSYPDQPLHRASQRQYNTSVYFSLDPYMQVHHCTMQ